MGSTEQMTLNDAVAVDGRTSFSGNSAAAVDGRTSFSGNSAALSWNSSLFFSSCVLCPKGEKYEDHVQEACAMDIFQYSTNNWLRSWMIRFDPKTYRINPDVEDKFSRDSDGWKLVKQITKLLLDSGQGTFVSNGANHRNRLCQREICCSRYRLYRKPKARKESTTATLIKRKRTFTSQPLHKDEKCTCRIVIRADANSYYVDCCVGNATHCNHPRAIDPNNGTAVVLKQLVPMDNVDTSHIDVHDDSTEDDNDCNDGHMEKENNADTNNDVASDDDNNNHVHEPFPIMAYRPRTERHFHREEWMAQQLCSLLVYCDDAFYDQIQQEMEEMVHRVQRHIRMRRQLQHDSH
jgi:hypothetical protein